MGIGPQLPPHLAHLSRRSASPKGSEEPNKAEAESTAMLSPEEGEEDDPYGPALPAHLKAARRTAAGPSRPASGSDDCSGRALGSRSPSPIRISRPAGQAIGPARPAAGPSRPVAGPARPSLDSPSPPRLAAARSAAPAPQYADDESDDDIGPSLDMLSAAGQGAAKSAAQEFREREERIQRAKEGKNADGSDEGPKRQEWMLVPPESGPLAHVDPLRKRPTTFSRSTADPSASSGADRSWTETPAERRQRIEDEMAGIKRPDPAKAKRQTQESDYGTKRRRDDEIRAEVERYSKQSRGESLLEKHQTSKASKKDKEEPPMIWDHARDMGVTGRLLNNEERQAKIRDARGLNDRFGHSSSGAYQI